MKKPYTLFVNFEASYYSSKAVAVKAGERSGASFTVTSPTGKVAHSVTVQAPVNTVKLCKKDVTHGVHRVTKGGSYCYACDRIVAEAQKAARAAAKAVTA